MSDSSVHSFEGFSETPLCDLPQTEVVSEQAHNARSSNKELESEPVRQGILRIRYIIFLIKFCAGAGTVTVEARLRMIVDRLVLAATDVVILVAHTMTARRLTPSRIFSPLIP